MKMNRTKFGGVRRAAGATLLGAASLLVVYTGCSTDDLGSNPTTDDGGDTSVDSGGVDSGVDGLGLNDAPQSAELASLSFAREVDGSVAAGEALLVWYADKGLALFDLSNPSKPRAGAEIPTASKVLAADFDEQRQLAYVVDATGTVSVVGVRSAGGARTLLSAVVPELGANAKGIARVGKRLFVLGAGKLHPLQLSFTEADEPTGLVVDASLTAEGDSLAAGGDALFLASAGKVQAWTVPATGALVAGGTFAVSGEVRGLLARGSKVILLIKDAGLRVVDFGDAAAPKTIFENVDLADVSSARLFGRTLAVGLARGSFHTIDLSDFAKPRVLTSNKGALPKLLAVQRGNLITSDGKSARIGGIPPVVSAAVPSLQRQAFPLTTPIPVVFSKPIAESTSPAEVKLLLNGASIEGTVIVSPDRLSLSFRPAQRLTPSANYVLDLSGVKDGSGLAVTAASAKVELTTTSEAPAPVVNAGSKLPHSADGAFTGFTVGGTNTGEWSDVTPAKGMYSYFYADFDGQNLWLLNDWFYASEKIDPDCYNQFGVWTKGGQEQWDIRSYGDKHIEVRKNGQLLGEGAEGFGGGYSFAGSPNAAEAHTIYELKIPAGAGRWGVQLHDPGPTFHCSTLINDPAPVSGSLGSEQNPKTSTVDYSQLQAPAQTKGDRLPADGSTNVSLTPTFVWSDQNAPDQFVSYLIEIASDAEFSQRIWQKITYAKTLNAPSALLAEATTYYWRITAINALGTSRGSVFSFKTGPEPTIEDAGADGASVRTCPAIQSDGSSAIGSDVGTCYADYTVAQTPYRLICNETQKFCFCRVNQTDGAQFANDNFTCETAQTMLNTLKARCLACESTEPTDAGPDASDASSPSEPACPQPPGDNDYGDTGQGFTSCTAAFFGVQNQFYLTCTGDTCQCRKNNDLTGSFPRVTSFTQLGGDQRNTCESQNLMYLAFQQHCPCNE